MEKEKDKEKNKQQEELAKKKKKQLEQKRFKDKYFEFYDDIKISDRQDW